MPELPEVETVCRGLANNITGKKIVHALVHNPKLRIPLPGDFAYSVNTLTVQTVSRRAKYILIECSRQMTLVIHLGMSGSVVIHKKPPAAYKKHDHVVFLLSDGSAVLYHDPRRFGLILLCATAEVKNHRLFSHLGPEPLGDTWKRVDLYNALQNKKSPVKTVIMDQQVVVGVGNIYACEALFEAGIHPARAAYLVTAHEATKLHKAIRNVLRAAIASGGSTLKDYVKSSGDTGYFQHRFRVYDRRGVPCKVCTTAITSIRQSGRSSFFCPSCQK